MVFSGFQYPAPPLSIGMELALSAAEAVARLVLRSGKSPPGGGKIRKPSAPPRAVVIAARTETASNPAHRGAGNHSPNPADPRTRTTSTRTTAGRSACGQNSTRRPGSVRFKAGPAPDPPWSHQSLREARAGTYNACSERVRSSRLGLTCANRGRLVACPRVKRAQPTHRRRLTHLRGTSPRKRADASVLVLALR